MNQDFLTQLQHQAAKQSKLNTTRFFPAQLDWLTSLIGRYSWQVLLLSSGLTAVALEVLRRWQ